MKHIKEFVDTLTSMELRSLRESVKVGDKVVCKFESIGLEVGRVYTVEGVDGEQIKVMNCFFDMHWYEKELFQFAYQNQKPRDFPEESGKPVDLPKYVLVEAKKDEFLKQVNELIAKGYKPQGGVAVDQAYYIQAMILEN